MGKLMMKSTMNMITNVFIIWRYRVAPSPRPIEHYVSPFACCSSVSTLSELDSGKSIMLSGLSNFFFR